LYKTYIEVRQEQQQHVQKARKVKVKGQGQNRASTSKGYNSHILYKIISGFIAVVAIYKFYHHAKIGIFIFDINVTMPL
jgi:hypothetical protein